VADITIAHPVTAVTSGPLRGKLDTGADLAVIPDEVVARLGLTPHRQVWARGYDGTYSQRGVYYVRLSIEKNEILAVRCLAGARDTVLVGRNVLNRFVITLDGRRLRFTLRLA
jgi:predicted aspartyl protease